MEQSLQLLALASLFVICLPGMTLVLYITFKLGKLVTSLIREGLQSLAN